jgi:thiamine-phosphate pyrophosphorylase
MSAALPEPCLCLVTDRRVAGDGDLVRRVALAVEGGVNMVQVREKDLPGGPLLRLTREISAAIGDRAVLLVNERVDVASAAEAQGVQLGEEALPADAARRLLTPGALIGRSVHSVPGAAGAIAGGADFLVVGTMFASDSHPGFQAGGPELMRAVALGRRTPLIGIGGINTNNLQHVVSAGASGVAVIRGILAASDPRAAAEGLKQALLEAWERRVELVGPASRGRSAAEND